MEEQDLIKELQTLGDEKALADAVATDMGKKNPRYAAVDAWTLAGLFGLDPDDNADWGRSFYAYRTRMQDLGLDQPCAENIEVLEGQIPKKRFDELKARAASALKRGRSDMRLRREERRLMEEKLTESENPGSDLIYISKSIETSSGDWLEFEGLVGDGGEVCEFYGPYEIDRCKGVDLDDYVWIE